MSAVTLEPIQRTTAARAVAEQILARIRDGMWRPGDRLPAERELMETLGVGRSSVREALQALATINVVEPRAGSGTFVREVRPADVLRADLLGLLIGRGMAGELLEARQLMEPWAVRLACIRGTADDLRAIDRLLEEHQTALDAGLPINSYAARFHLMLAAAAHNRVISSFMESILGLLTHRGRQLERVPRYAEREIAEHRAILELVRDGEAEAAAAAMTEHIIVAAETYDVTIDSEGERRP